MPITILKIRSQHLKENTYAITYSKTNCNAFLCPTWKINKCTIYQDGFSVFPIGICGSLKTGPTYTGGSITTVSNLTDFTLPSLR